MAVRVMTASPIITGSQQIVSASRLIWLCSLSAKVFARRVHSVISGRLAGWQAQAGGYLVQQVEKSLEQQAPVLWQLLQTRVDGIGNGKSVRQICKRWRLKVSVVTTTSHECIICECCTETGRERLLHVGRDQRSRQRTQEALQQSGDGVDVQAPNVVDYDALVAQVGDAGDLAVVAVEPKDALALESVYTSLASQTRDRSLSL